MEMSEIVGSSCRRIKKRKRSLLAASWMMDPIYLLSDELTDISSNVGVSATATQLRNLLC